MTAVAQNAARRPRLEAFRSDESALKEPPLDPRTEALLTRAKRDAHAQGLAEGAAAARENIEAEIAEAVEAALADQSLRAADAAASSLAEALNAWLSEQNAVAERVRDAAERALCSAIEAIAPRLATEGLAAEVAGVLADRLARAASAGEGRLFVHPDAVEKLRAAIAPLEHVAAAWEVVEEPDARPGAARAEWRDAVAEFDLADAAETVLAEALARWRVEPTTTPREPQEEIQS